jgi:DNA-binding XRE family transcriptional regulator
MPKKGQFSRSKLRAIRHTYGESQEALADRIGVHPTTIKRIGCGRRKPSRGMAYRIADAYGIDIEDLYDEVPS